MARNILPLSLFHVLFTFLLLIFCIHRVSALPTDRDLITLDRITTEPSKLTTAEGMQLEKRLTKDSNGDVVIRKSYRSGGMRGRGGLGWGMVVGIVVGVVAFGGLVL
ncbi:hypothetical protein BJ508DRAFT_159259 [Ascobolus immersus RN42]|uniref:Transmembrane protein n=1 Tax=Ascobolus immersus RN42 TaxID=1160509 RepID=A0A3N4IJN0_ASCIM|nr:hypothetical protein BJ508DRAFT_159259 [Ascobolus immersus RN42]